MKDGKGPPQQPHSSPGKEPAGKRLRAEVDVTLTSGRRGQTVNHHPLLWAEEKALQSFREAAGAWKSTQAWRGSLRDWMVGCLYRSRERPSLIVIPSHESICGQHGITAGVCM